MTKYTVYEIEKLTSGKLSKYKLNKAIEEGRLKAEKASFTKKGRGTPKYYVHEEELESYLKEMNQSSHRHISLMDDTLKEGLEERIKSIVGYTLEQNQDVIMRHNGELETLRKRLHMLETRLGTETTDDSIYESVNLDHNQKTLRRHELLNKLETLGIFDVKERKDVLEELHRIA